MVTYCHHGYLVLPQSGNTACGSSVLGQLRPIIVNLIEKEREYVQSDLRKNRSQFIKNIASISHNITGGRNYAPNTVSLPSLLPLVFYLVNFILINGRF